MTGFGHNSREMEKIRAAVVGVGYLGRFHAQKYALLQDCELIGVVVSSAEAAAAVAAEVGTEPYSDFRALLGQVDAVSVATPTPTHCDIALTSSRLARMRSLETGLPTARRRRSG